MLFKILHGDSSRISLDTTPFHEGWAYVTHDGYFYIDLNTGTEEQPNNQRLKLNAGNCETLAGKTWEEIQAMIPTKVSDLENDAQYITGGEKEINSEAAYIKNVPESASSVAKVNKIGGLTRKCINLFAYNTFVANGYTTRFNVTPGEVLYCADGIDFPMQWGIYDVNGALIGTFYDFGFTNSSPLTVPSNASYVEVKAYGGQQGTYTQDGVCVGIPNGDSEHVLLINDGCYGVIHKGDIVKIGAGYYTVIEDAPAGDAEIEIRISPALADSDINGEAYLATANEVQAAMQKYVSLYIGYEPYSEGLRSAPVTKVESGGVNLFDPASIGTKTFIGLTYTTEGSYVKINGTKANGANVHIMTAPNMTLPAGTYTVSVRMVSGTVSGIEANGGVFFGINQSTYGQRTTPGVSKVGDVGVRTFTLSEPTLVSSFDIAPDYASVGAVFDNAVFACQFERANTVGDFKPYTRNTLPVPEAVRPKHGINEEVYDYIDLDAKQSVERVGVADMGMIDWLYNGYANDGTTTIMYSRLLSMQNLSPVLCSAFEQAERTQWENLTIGEIMSEHDNYIVVATNYTDVETFKAAMSGVMLYYELATPVVTDISDLLPSDNTLPVEANGTVTMVNEYGYDVPSEVTFYTNASEHINASEFVGNLTGTATRAIADKYGNDIAETYITADALSGLGGGDMLKATYDKDGDDIVDEAAHATTADSATAAVTATSAIQDGQGRNIADVLDSKSSLKHDYLVSAGDGSTHYYKLLTFTPTSSYIDSYYEFDVVARTNKYATIRVFLITASTQYITSAYVTYDGNMGNAISAYVYKDEANGVNRLEVWGTVGSWDTWCIFPKTYRYNSGLTLTWDCVEGSALPTDATSTITPTPHEAGYAISAGSANTATSATTAASANQVLINRSGSDTYFPIILTNSGDGTTSKVDSVYASTNNTVTMNPATGAVKAAKFEGNATSATKATQDENGKNIVNTYATKTELDGKAPSGYGFGESANVHVSASDIDYLSKTGFYQFVTDVFDGSATNYYLIHQIHTDTYACQIAIQVVNPNIIYQRIKRGGTWEGWTQYITPANIGSQSVNYATTAGGVAWDNVSGKPSFATVATSGKYSDLSGKPSIPAAANNGTLTIQKNGTTVATFGANQSTAATANITVPTKTSELTNDSGFKNIGYGTTLPSTGVNGQIFLLQG